MEQRDRMNDAEQKPKEFYWTFGECEHRGDAEAYANFLRRCGATIHEYGLTDEYEKGYVVFTVSDEEAFTEKYRASESEWR